MEEEGQGSFGFPDGPPKGSVEEAMINFLKVRPRRRRSERRSSSSSRAGGRGRGRSRGARRRGEPTTILYEASPFTTLLWASVCVVTGLQGVHLPSAASRVPLHPHLLRVRHGGHPEVRARQGSRAYRVEDTQVRHPHTF